MPDALNRLADGIDRVTTVVGRAAAWLALVVVLLEMAIIVMRSALGLGSIWLGESVIYSHAALFMLAAAWGLKEDRHVRVDIVYAHASPRLKAGIDLAGAALLLIPFMAVLAYFAVPYTARSWQILERSREASGLPFVYLLKTLIPAFAMLLGMQGLAQAVRAVAVLRAG